MSQLTARVRPVWRRRDRKDFWCLTGAISMVGLALGTLLPLTALALDRQGFSGATIGLIIAVHALGLVAAIGICEPAVHRYGARKTIEYAGLGAAATALFMQQLSNVWSLSVALFILGVLLGVVLNMVETWVNLAIPDAQRGRWLAVHCTLFTLFQLCGPLVLQCVSPARAFAVCAALMLLAWPVFRGLSQRNLSDEAPHSDRKHDWPRDLRTAPVIVISTALFALFDTLVLSLLPVYALAQGMDTPNALASASVVLAGDTALEIVVGAMADRWGRVRVHTACAAVLVGSALLLPFTIATLFWWADLFVMGGAAGGIYVLSMMACGQRFSGSHLLRMTALLGSVWGVASIAGPLVTGALMAHASRWSLPSVIGAVAATLLWALAYEQRQHPYSLELPTHV